jgi:serine/threonine protein kinase
MPLLTAYVQNDIYNLLFPPADMNLDNFLLRASSFQEDRTIIKAIHELSSGLKHLHYYEREDSQISGTTGLLQGTHQDIKPKNVLVIENNLLLADFGLSRLKPVENLVPFQPGVSNDYLCVLAS